MCGDSHTSAGLERVGLGCCPWLFGAGNGFPALLVIWCWKWVPRLVSLSQSAGDKVSRWKLPKLSLGQRGCDAHQITWRFIATDFPVLSQISKFNFPYFPILCKILFFTSYLGLVEEGHVEMSRDCTDSLIQACPPSAWKHGLQNSVRIHP